MNDGISHPERSSDGTEGVASAEKGIINNTISAERAHHLAIINKIASPFSNYQFL